MIPFAQLPCPLAPLQGVTERPSHQVPYRRELTFGSCAGQFPFVRSLGAPRVQLPSTVIQGFQVSHPSLASGFRRNVWVGDPTPVPYRTTRNNSASPTSFILGFASPEPTPRGKRLRADRTSFTGSSAAPRGGLDRGADSRPGFDRRLRRVVCPLGYSLRRFRRLGFPRCFVSPGPSEPHQLPTEAGRGQDTQRDNNGSSPGVRSLATFELGRSLCCFTKPTPSVHRVSHPLNGLIPPGPCGSISCHTRP